MEAFPEGAAAASHVVNMPEITCLLDGAANGSVSWMSDTTLVAIAKQRRGPRLGGAMCTRAVKACRFLDAHRNEPLPPLFVDPAPRAVCSLGRWIRYLVETLLAK